PDGSFRRRTSHAGTPAVSGRPLRDRRRDPPRRGADQARSPRPGSLPPGGRRLEEAGRPGAGDAVLRPVTDPQEDPAFRPSLPVSRSPAVLFSRFPVLKAPFSHPLPVPRFPALAFMEEGSSLVAKGKPLHDVQGGDPMLRYLTAGESHGRALVAIVEGVPA